MTFVFDKRASDSSLVASVWRTQGDGGSFIAPASINFEMIVTKQKGAITFSLLGPETKASRAPIPEDAEIFGMTFKLGTFMPHLPATHLVDGGINLPEAASKSFWLHGSVWQFPDFENADTFVERLVRQGLLAHEPIIEAALQGQTNELSERSIQRRFLRTTGLTHKAIFQIERARHAMTLLQQGVSILDTVEQAGYYDQPHLTKALKHLIGQTPAEILRGDESE